MLVGVYLFRGKPRGGVLYTNSALVDGLSLNLGIMQANCEMRFLFCRKLTPLNSKHWEKFEQIKRFIKTIQFEEIKVTRAAQVWPCLICAVDVAQRCGVYI